MREKVGSEASNAWVLSAARFFMESALFAVVARWQRWVFEASTPLDEFSRSLTRALVARGIDVSPGTRFDLVARAFGARAFVKLSFADQGIEAVVKIKSGVFAAPRALERVVLEAGREAQTRADGGERA